MYNKSFAESVDQAWKYMYAANAQEPYDHAPYKRAEAFMSAALLMYCEGDEELAQGLDHLMIGNGEQGVDYFAHTIPEDEIRQYAS